MRRITPQDEQKKDDKARLKAVAGMLLGLSYKEMMELTALLQKYEGVDEYPLQLVAVAEDILRT